MKISVLIQEGPYNHEASDSAYNFIQAALAKGHTIRGIFFYDDGVYNATKLMEPPQDDRHISRRWSELGATGIDMIVCVAAAKRRGITNEVLVPNIRISGLGQLASMIDECDPPALPVGLDRPAHRAGRHAPQNACRFPRIGRWQACDLHINPTQPGTMPGSPIRGTSNSIQSSMKSLPCNAPPATGSCVRVSGL